MKIFVLLEDLKIYHHQVNNFLRQASLCGNTNLDAFSERLFDLLFIFCHPH